MTGVGVGYGVGVCVFVAVGALLVQLGSGVPKNSCGLENSKVWVADWLPEKLHAVVKASSKDKTNK